MKTKRLFLLALLLLFSLSVFALDISIVTNRVADNAGLLSLEQKTQLQERIEAIAAAYNFDLVIVTQKTIGGSDPDEYADKFFDTTVGPGKDGCLFLQVTDSRDYSISPSGRGEKILNNFAFDKLEADALEFLKANKPFEAYRSFISSWEEFLALDAKGRNYNFFHQWNIFLVIGAWVLAAALGFLVVTDWKSKMNTALAQAKADSYTVPGSLAYSEKKDSFLYSNVTKIKRQSQSSSSSSRSRRR